MACCLTCCGLAEQIINHYLIGRYSPSRSKYRFQSSQTAAAAAAHFETNQAKRGMILTRFPPSFSSSSLVSTLDWNQSVGGQGMSTLDWNSVAWKDSCTTPPPYWNTLEWGSENKSSTVCVCPAEKKKREKDPSICSQLFFSVLFSLYLRWFLVSQTERDGWRRQTLCPARRTRDSGSGINTSFLSFSLSSTYVLSDGQWYSRGLGRRAREREIGGRQDDDVISYVTHLILNNVDTYQRIKYIYIYISSPRSRSGWCSRPSNHLTRIWWWSVYAIVQLLSFLFSFVSVDSL